MTASDSGPSTATGTSTTAPSSATVPTGNHYDKYGSGNPIVQRLMTGFMSALDDLLPTEPPRRILEVGVGEGEIYERLRERYPDADVAAIDLPDDDLAREWQRRGIPATFADATSLPFGDDHFDLVLAIEVLEHVPGPSRALDEIARVATGDVVVSVPREPMWRAANMARGKYLAQLGNTPGHVNHWSRRGFQEFVSTRLSVTDVRSPFPWTMLRATIS